MKTLPTPATPALGDEIGILHRGLMRFIDQHVATIPEPRLAELCRIDEVLSVARHELTGTVFPAVDTSPQDDQPQTGRWALAAAVGAGTPLPEEVRMALASLVATVGLHASHGTPDDVAAPCEMCYVATDFQTAVDAFDRAVTR